MRFSIRSITWLVLALGLQAPAWAAPSVQPDYRVELQRGRKAVSEGAYPDAITAFETALRARPADPMALSELGWAAFLAGDLLRARSTTNQALTLAKDRSLRAACLYNLGRIAEGSGDLKAAIEAYRGSVQLRKNAEVNGRLAALDPTTPAQAPLASTILQGPFPSLAAYCDKIRRSPADQCPGEFVWANQYFGMQNSLTQPPAPLRTVRVISVMPPTGGENTCHLVVETANGWYGMPLESDNGCFPHALVLQDQGPGRAPMIALKLLTFPAVVLNNRPNARWIGYYQPWLHVCAVGQSGKPSCLGPVDLGRISQRTIEDLGDGETPVWDYKRSALFEPAGTLRIKPDDWKPGEPLEEPAQLGSYRLVFP
jgi:tetratricopeptide (TPR) repeat protein